MNNNSTKFTGAGILPYAIDSKGNVNFLLHRTFKGKKARYLIDFGGSISNDDCADSAPPLFTAIREFCEETAGLITSENLDDIQQNLENYFSKNNSEPFYFDNNITEETVQSSKLVKDAITSLYKHFKQQEEIIHTINNTYMLYFIEIKYIDLTLINEIFLKIFKKIREFRWVSATDILTNQTPLPLYDRARNSKNFLDIINKITQTFQNKQNNKIPRTSLILN
jgi:hypothetical protein